ncbi:MULTISPECIES: PLDc N-terminal domain-containing protein [Gracilibacillus]|uniref:Negative regulator of sigma-Y activity n=1 Tax=Gracilibacillus thailandensis TaxID=563735 RepID=A0A6N7R4C6_9BACI|nr:MULTISPECIES: PLDc N-terminal domain-containing protein [Gracilibacillus]MRI68056.1 negative regulator of sigma-Y activity [Gracilibacillus thailandensis]
MDVIMMLAPLIIIQFLLMIVAIIALLKTEQTNGPKPMWAAIIILIGFIGPILFFIVGRRQY